MGPEKGTKDDQWTRNTILGADSDGAGEAGLEERHSLQPAGHSRDRLCPPLQRHRKADSE